VNAQPSSDFYVQQRCDFCAGLCVDLLGVANRGRFANVYRGPLAEVVVVLGRMFTGRLKG
jgi:hypothetical protein